MKGKTKKVEMFIDPSVRDSEIRYRRLFEAARDGILILNAETGMIEDVNPFLIEMLGYSREEFVKRKLWEVGAFKDIESSQDAFEALQKSEYIRYEDLPLKTKAGVLIQVEFVSNVYLADGEKVIQCNIRDITERKQLETALQASEERFRALVENSVDIIALLTATGIVLYESPAIVRILGYQLVDMVGRNAFEFVHPDEYAICEELFGKLFQSPKTPITAEFRHKRKDGTWSWVNATGIDLLMEPSVNAIVVNYHDITERKHAEDKIRQQLEHLIALSAIERTITANFNLELSLTTLLVHTLAQLNVDAAAVLLFDSDSLKLKYAATQGFRTKNIKQLQLPLLDGYCGRVVLNRQVVKIPNIKDKQEKVWLSDFLADDDFVCYYGVPLIAKGQVKGVLEVFHRAALEPDSEWFNFLNALAGQGAIAIENVALFESLQRSNYELSLAYDATIEGWSRALDLRDRETEGHTQRVTEMTMNLARAFDLSNDELAQVRWGALLHDIGKMGVPDHILLKPGSLTDEEWVTMKKHPAFAYELLAPIRHLQQALDIPYCHHEKWDGTGYPRGLKGNHIPLVARIFTVVDVWDALISDRPYRAAWAKEKAREHIRTSSGTHFDPRVVDVFMKIPDNI